MMVIIGFIFSLLIGWWAYRKESLSISGVYGAILIGTLYFGIGDLKWYGVLLAFFLSSSLLSRYRIKEKQKFEEGYEKTGKRDFSQTIANGGVGALLIIFASIYPEWEAVMFIAFLGVMATVTADTWGSEIGVLSKKPPRSILTGRILEPGRSGGVTLLGTVAGGIGAGFIGLFGISLSFINPLFQLHLVIWLLLIAIISGMFGSLFDSLLGILFQRMNRCQVCGKQLESATHCGKSTVYYKGMTWLNNDLVNGVSSLFGGMIAFMLALIIL